MRGCLSVISDNHSLFLARNRERRGQDIRVGHSRTIGRGLLTHLGGPTFAKPQILGSNTMRELRSKKSCKCWKTLAFLIFSAVVFVTRRTFMATCGTRLVLSFVRSLALTFISILPSMKHPINTSAELPLKSGFMAPFEQ